MLNAIALYDCVADEEGELSFTEGTRFVDVVDSSERNWLEGRIEGTSQRGLFPSNYVNVISISSTPSLVKVIPKTSNSDAILSHSVSPPNSNISSSWSVIHNSPTNNSMDILSNSFSSSKSAKQDVFDSASQTPASSQYSDMAATIMNKRTMPKPTISSNSPNNTTTTTIGNFTATTNNTNNSPSSSRTSVLPVLSPVQQQTRARSFSASSTTSPAPPTALKPSTLRQDYRKKTQMDTSWRTKLDNESMPTATTSTNFATRPSSNKVTDNKMTITNSTGNDDEDMEEEDGYQLVKPSQLRKRQQQQLLQDKDIGKINSATFPLSSSVSTSALPTQKSSTSSKTRLQTLPSSSTTCLAKLPSRPVSNANRLSKSRSSSTRSNSSSSVTKSNNSSTNTTEKNGNNISIATTNNKIAPILKPKPAQLNNLPKTSIMTTKERSASNPPPIQPKSFISSNIYRPSKPAVDSKPLFPLPASHTEKNGTISKPTPPVGARGGVALPGLGKKSSAPTLPTRPPTTSTISPASGSTTDGIFKGKQHVDENTNLKPSQLLNTQRARSSTNPSLASRPFIDVTNGNRNGTKKLSSTPLDTPIDGAIRSPPPPPTSTSSTATTKTTSSPPAIPLIIKQAPPPPPPSRQINHNNNNNNNKNEFGGRTRYDELFDTIQDDGYVDGMTVQVIWNKSRLPDDTLAGIWQQCDQQKSGLLDKQRFIHGMRQIDSYLAKNMMSVP